MRVYSRSINLSSYSAHAYFLQINDPTTSGAEFDSSSIDVTDEDNISCDNDKGFPAK